MKKIEIACLLFIISAFSTVMTFFAGPMHSLSKIWTMRICSAVLTVIFWALVWKWGGAVWWRKTKVTLETRQTLRLGFICLLIGVGVFAWDTMFKKGEVRVSLAFATIIGLVLIILGGSMVAIAISVAAARSRDGYTADSTIGSTDSEHKELLKEKAILSKLNMEDFTKPSENILSQPNEKDIIELNKMYFFKSSESLFEIYNNRHSDEYRQEAIETVRRILARRLEDFLKKKNEDQL